MTDHEQMMISAERYALGRRTYIVSDTINYIARHIDGMSEHCKHVLIEDIKHPLYGNYGDECDKKDWMWLLKKLEEAEMICGLTKQPCSECKPICNEKVCKFKE